MRDNSNPSEQIKAYSISQFCKMHGDMSRPFFYNLLKKGKAPRLMHLGGRVLISVEAADEWRKQIEMGGTL